MSEVPPLCHILGLSHRGRAERVGFSLAAGVGFNAANTAGGFLGFFLVFAFAPFCPACLSLCVCHRFSVCFAAVMDPNASSGLLGALRAALSPFCVCCILRAGSGSHPQLQALFTALSLPALPADAF